MLTEIQSVILTCLLGPEDKGAFKRFLSRKRVERFKAKDPREFQIRANERTKKSRVNNQERTRKQGREYQRKYRILDPEGVKEKARRYASKRCKNPEFRLLKSLRIRLNKALKGQSRSAHTVELLGCSVNHLREHLKKSFVSGMTWENYGLVWHVDHIKPCAKFDLSDPSQQRACFHWTNLQPLFALDNIRKGDKYAG